MEHRDYSRSEPSSAGYDFNMRRFLMVSTNLQKYYKMLLKVTEIQQYQMSTLGFSLNGAELSLNLLNSVNSENLRNH